MTVGDLIVIAVIAVIVFFVIRSIVRSKKSGGACTGNCASCSKCGGGKTHKS